MGLGRFEGEGLFELLDAEGEGGDLGGGGVGGRLVVWVFLLLLLLLLDAEYRAAVRNKLNQQKAKSELFNVGGYATDFLALLERLSAHHRAGGKPSEFPTHVGVSASDL